MSVFNRVVMILLLGGLFVLGVYAVVYAFDLFDYALSDALDPLGSFVSGAQSFTNGVETGNVPPQTVATLVLVALLGLILLIAELKPPTPRRVRMHKGTYITRDVVKREAESAADRALGVVGASARVKARRKPGARINLDARVRHGENTSAIGSDLRDSIQQHLATRGIPVSTVKVKLAEVDPRDSVAETRVQ
jgi:hypothetical protein